MNKTTITSKHGYQIPIVSEMSKYDSKIAIAVHGFGSHKLSTTNLMLLRELPKKGIGVISFDFPNHGDHAEEGEAFRVKNCLDDLKSVENYVAAQFPGVEIMYFASSFGAYITMLYLCRGRGNGTKAFFRSAAVNMPELFLNPTPDEVDSVRDKGYFLVEDCDRPIKLTQGFIDDMAANDLFEIFEKYKEIIDYSEIRLKMIHGDCDESVDYEKAAEFANKFGIELVTVHGGDHRLMIPGAPERVLDEALNLFNL